MRNAGLDEAQAGIKVAGRNINKLGYADGITLMAETKRTKEPLAESEREEWKSWLKTQHQKTKIMASGPITSWQMDGETMETMTDFIFLGSKSLQMVTTAMKFKDTCSLEEKLWPA